jgi:ABC-type hemin transport system substrate-binding protein
MAAQQNLEMFGHLSHSLQQASRQMVQASQQIEAASRRMDAASQRVDLFFAWAGSGQPLAQQSATNSGE